MTSGSPDHRPGEHCITCSDEGVPMVVLRIDEPCGLALCVDGDGVRHTVESALIERLAIGDGLLVHAGVAIARSAGGAV